MIRNSKRIDLHKPFGPRVFQINLKCNIYFFLNPLKYVSTLKPLLLLRLRSV